MGKPSNKEAKTRTFLYFEPGPNANGKKIAEMAASLEATLKKSDNSGQSSDEKKP